MITKPMTIHQAESKMVECMHVAAKAHDRLEKTRPHDANYLTDINLERVAMRNATEFASIVNMPRVIRVLTAATWCAEHGHIDMADFWASVARRIDNV